MPAVSEDYLLLLPNRFRQNQFLHRIAFILFAFTVILCIFFLVSFYFNTKYTKPSILPNYACAVPKFDYSLLALRWGPTFCLTKPCVKPAEDFQIHGLWPNYNNGSYPQFCCKQWQFDPQTVNPLLKELIEKWPNQIPNQAEDSLWKHEWIKHGTCLEKAREGAMFAYFNETLTLYDQYPIEKWLQEASIVPTPLNNITYSLQEIHSAIESKTNHTISIQCDKVSRKESKQQLLDTIYICFKGPDFTPFDCPQGDSCNKKQPITFPQLTTKPTTSRRKNRPN